MWLRAVATHAARALPVVEGLPVLANALVALPIAKAVLNMVVAQVASTTDAVIARAPGMIIGLAMMTVATTVVEVVVAIR